MKVGAAVKRKAEKRRSSGSRPMLDFLFCLKNVVFATSINFFWTKVSQQFLRHPNRFEFWIPKMFGSRETAVAPKVKYRPERVAYEKLF